MLGKMILKKVRGFPNLIPLFRLVDSFPKNNPEWLTFSSFGRGPGKRLEIIPWDFSGSNGILLYSRKGPNSNRKKI